MSYLVNFIYHFTKSPGSDAVYRVTLKASSKAGSGTRNTTYIKVTGPHSSTNETSMDGIWANRQKSVDIDEDVGLPSCVTVRNLGGDDLLIEWVRRNEICCN